MPITYNGIVASGPGASIPFTANVPASTPASMELIAVSANIVLSGPILPTFSIRDSAAVVAPPYACKGFDRNQYWTVVYGGLSLQDTFPSPTVIAAWLLSGIFFPITAGDALTLSITSAGSPVTAIDMSAAWFSGVAASAHAGLPGFPGPADPIGFQGGGATGATNACDGGEIPRGGGSFALSGSPAEALVLGESGCSNLAEGFCGPGDTGSCGFCTGTGGGTINPGVPSWVLTTLNQYSDSGGSSEGHALVGQTAFGYAVIGGSPTSVDWTTQWACPGANGCTAPFSAGFRNFVLRGAGMAAFAGGPGPPVCPPDAYINVSAGVRTGL